MTNPPTPQEQVDPVSYKLAEAIQAQCDIWKQDGVTKWHAIDIYPIIRTTIAALTEEKAGLETKLAELRSGYLSAVSEAERKLIRIYIDKLSTLEQELATAKVEIARLNAVILDTEEALGSARNNLFKVREQSEKLEQERDGLKRDCEILTFEKDQLKELFSEDNSHLTAMRQALEPIVKLGENLQSHGPGYIAAWMADHKYVEAVPIALLLKANAALKSAPGQELMGDKEQAKSGHAARVKLLQQTIRVFDQFRAACPMEDLAEEFNRRMAIYRSELQARQSIDSAKKGSNE